MKIAISSGHGKHIRGASSIYGDEVDEARKVVERVAAYLRDMGVETWTFHDDISDDQSENLNRIVNWHNARPDHDLDVSIHFNAYEVTTKPMGSEVYNYPGSSAESIAREVVDAICAASGLTNRGQKTAKFTFLVETAAPAILVETCFIDSEWDMSTYREMFDPICEAIAGAISGEEIDTGPQPPEPPELERLFHAEGRMSTFGGPDDTGVAFDEGLAFWSSAQEMRDHDAGSYIMSAARAGAPGLARRLIPEKHYVACRWNYDVTSKAFLRDAVATVSAGGRTIRGVRPMDWGPHEDTGRVADLSPGLAEALGLDTDDTCEVTIYAEAVT